MSRSLVHPRRSASMANKFPDRATFRAQTQRFKNDRGIPSITRAAVQGLTNLPCQRIPFKSTENVGKEDLGVDGTTSMLLFTLLFQNYHDAITEEMDCVIDGETYNVLLVDRDPTSNHSLLKVQLHHGD